MGRPPLFDGTVREVTNPTHGCGSGAVAGASCPGAVGAGRL